MESIWAGMQDKFRPWLRASQQSLSDVTTWLSRDTHRFTITGLSRSGKSMLFTSLMTMLNYRTKHGYACLPLLTHLPVSLLEDISVKPLPGFAEFDVESNLALLEQGHWPKPTTEAYGFVLSIKLRRARGLTRWLLPHSHIQLEFIDYPGEWLTDLPLLNQSYSAWSNAAWAQQSGGPQFHHSAQWRDYVSQFDFEQPCTLAARMQLTDKYIDYIRAAKQDGITLLQPGSFLLNQPMLRLDEMGFTPLPSVVLSDPSHPWTQAFDSNYQRFCRDFLSPIREKIFRQTDKQIILVDVYEGLNHSREHLYQLKETMSYLADSFTYGQKNWLLKALGKKGISKVAFVATKADQVPVSQHPQLLNLLKLISDGARAKFATSDVEAEHFLVSAIEATDAGADTDALRFHHIREGYIEARFEPLPDSFKQLDENSHYPVLEIGVPQDYLPRMLNSRGLDRLFQFLLD